MYVYCVYRVCILVYAYEHIYTFVYNTYTHCLGHKMANSINLHQGKKIRNIFYVTAKVHLNKL